MNSDKIVEFKNEIGQVVATATFEGEWDYSSYSQARAALVVLQKVVAESEYCIDLTQEPAKSLLEAQTDRLIRGLQLPDDRLPDEKG